MPRRGDEVQARMQALARKLLATVPPPPKPEAFDWQLTPEQVAKLQEIVEAHVRGRPGMGGVGADGRGSLREVLGMVLPADGLTEEQKAAARDHAITCSFHAILADLAEGRPSVDALHQELRPRIEKLLEEMLGP